MASLIAYERKSRVIMGIFGNRAERRKAKSLECSGGLARAESHLQSMRDELSELKAAQDELKREGDEEGSATTAEMVALAEKMILDSERLLAGAKSGVPLP